MPPISGGQFPSFSQHDIANQFLTMDGHNRAGTSVSLVSVYRAAYNYCFT